MPIIVMQSKMPVMRWPKANSQPKNTSHKILPIKLPAPKWPIEIFRPKGASTSPAILKHWRPKGMPIIVAQHMTPANNHPRDVIKPPNNIQTKFPKIPKLFPPNNYLPNTIIC